MNPLLFFNHQQIKQPFDPSQLQIVNGVAIIRWDNSAEALQAIVYCLLERHSFFISSSAWTDSFYDPFLSLINAHGCPATSCLIATFHRWGPKLCVQPIANLFLKRATEMLPSVNDPEFVWPSPLSPWADCCLLKPFLFSDQFIYVGIIGSLI